MSESSEKGRCGQCRWYVACVEIGGECRFNPPTHPDGFPDVREEEWCRQFSRAPVVETEMTPEQINLQARRERELSRDLDKVIPGRVEPLARPRYPHDRMWIPYGGACPACGAVAGEECHD